MPSHDSPESAALTGFSAGCRVVGSRVHDDAAYVLLDTGPAENPYLYGVTCIREAAEWRHGSSANGPGWTLLDSDGETGVMSLWGEAPAGAEKVRAEFDGDVLEAPVEQGVYLAVWWNVPRSCVARPTVREIRVGGVWAPPST